MRDARESIAFRRRAADRASRALFALAALVAGYRLLASGRRRAWSAGTDSL